MSQLGCRKKMMGSIELDDKDENAVVVVAVMVSHPDKSWRSAAAVRSDST